MVIPYVEGLAEDARRVCRDYAVQVVFKSGPTLKEKLTKVKDKLAIDKRSNVVYQSCGKYYIDETTGRLGTRIREHRDARERCLTEKFAVAEHA